MKLVEEQLVLIQCGVDEILVEVELVVKLKCGQFLWIKVGFDLIVFDLYFGYIVFINKLCQFQDLGYQVIFFIGDFIGMIGDFSGKSVICFFLMCEQVLENVEMYKFQVFKIFDFVKIEVVFNFIWMD